MPDMADYTLDQEDAMPPSLSVIEKIINDICERPEGEGPDDPDDPDIVITTKQYLRICMERWLPHAYWPKD